MCQALIKNGRDHFENKSNIQVEYEKLLKQHEHLLQVDAKQTNYSTKEIQEYRNIQEDQEEKLQSLDQQLQQKDENIEYLNEKILSMNTELINLQNQLSPSKINNGRNNYELSDERIKMIPDISCHMQYQKLQITLKDIEIENKNFKKQNKNLNFEIEQADAKVLKYKQDMKQLQKTIDKQEDKLLKFD